MGRDLLQLLPVLLDGNQPGLPGHLADYPLGGIVDFFADAEQQQLCRDYFNLAPASSPRADADIHGLYTIGSTATLGQSARSDLDIWVCHRPAITDDHRRLLQQKCTLIEQWSQQLGVELHLFLVSPDQFQQGQQTNLDSESSGSAQHWLLLDEFYRTALRLAGKPILWQQLHHAPDSSYEQQCRRFFDEQGGHADQYLDFGDIPSPPAEEYFGAILWQLYKGIDAPEKSILKALLLESYFADYPDTELLCDEWRRRLHQDDAPVDAYQLLLERLSRHLERQQDSQRLELIRRCFYLKCAPGLSHLNRDSQPNWQQQQLQALVQQWGWSRQQLRDLDRTRRWTPVELHQHHRQLVAALLQSYKHLVLMANRHHISESIFPQEMAMLSRRLYSVYEPSPSKVNQLPEQKLPQRSNQQLFIRRGRVDAQQNAGWLLLNRAPVFGRDHNIHHDTQVIRLLAWAAINQIGNGQTQVIVPADRSLSAVKMQRALGALYDFFPPNRKVSQAALSRPSAITELLVLVNMQDDATNQFHGQELIMNWIKSNVFSIGSTKHSLVSSIDIVYRNSWNELHALHFNGDLAILQALSHVLSKQQITTIRPAFKVVSLSHQLTPLLRDKVKFLFDECLSLRQQSVEQGVKVKSFVVAGQLYGLFFHSNEVSFQPINSAVELYQRLSHQPLAELPPTEADPVNRIARLIKQHASEGIVQFFLEPAGERYHVYILDEDNRLESYQQSATDELALVKAIYHFYTFARDKQNISQEKLTISFNLPQFNRLVQIDGEWAVQPLDNQDEQYIL